jgi:hypothetical protein
MFDWHGLARGLGRGASSLSGPPSGSFWSRWFGGVALPLVFAGYGLRCWMIRRGHLPGRRGVMELQGRQAVAFGIALLGLALFLHAHYFLDALDRWPGAAYLGKVAGLLLLVGGLIGLFRWFLVF